MKNSIVLSVFALAIAGCATQPTGISVDQAAAFRERGFSIDHVTGASSVTLKTKGRAIGGVLLGAVAGSLAASSPASMSPQGLQEAQEMGQVTNNLVQRGVAGTGDNIHQAQTPANAMAAAMTRSLRDSGIPIGGAAYHIDIKQTLWSLDYDSMFGSDNYRLHWQLSTSVIDSANKVVTTSVCQGDGDTKQALDAWKADDYAEVKEAAWKIGENCASQWLSDIGLRG